KAPGATLRGNCAIPAGTTPVIDGPGFAITVLVVPGTIATPDESEVDPLKLTCNARTKAGGVAGSASLYAAAFTPSVALPALALEMLCGTPFRSCAPRSKPPMVEPLVFASIA